MPLQKPIPLNINNKTKNCPIVYIAQLNLFLHDSNKQIVHLESLGDLEKLWKFCLLHAHLVMATMKMNLETHYEDEMLRMMILIVEMTMIMRLTSPWYM